MKHTSSKTLFTHWNEIRGTRQAPRRFEIEPARLASALPDAFILEQVAAESYRYRLAGTRLCEHFGAELRGQDFLSSWSDEDKRVLIGRLASVSEHGAVGLFEMEAFGSSRKAVHFEILIVPLVQNSARIDRFLGTMGATDEPAWLGAEPLTRRHLLRHELIWPSGRPQPNSAFRPILEPHIRDAKLVRTERRCFRVYEGGLSRSALDET